MEESTSAKCPSCGKNWILFPTRPSNLEEWLKPKGYWDRSRRCYPPNVFHSLLLGIGLYALMVIVDLWALFIQQVHMPFNPMIIFGVIIAYDVACTYLGLKTARVNMRKYRILKVLIVINLTITSLLILHTVINVVGPAFVKSLITYCFIRFVVSIITSFIFLRNRVYRALDRHSSDK